MKYVMFAALSMFSVFASANSSVNAASAQPVPQAVEYSYGQKLDIAKVIDVSSANDSSNTCSPVQVHMIYLDSKGVTHNLEYTRMSDSCQNG